MPTSRKTSPNAPRKLHRKKLNKTSSGKHASPRKTAQHQRLKETTSKISVFNKIEDNYYKLRPILLLFGVIACLYTGLSLLSYHPDDVENVVTNGVSANIGGVLGVYLAKFLFHNFGYGAWSILPIGGLFAWKLAGRDIGGPVRMLGWVGLLWAFLCVCDLLAPELTTGNYHSGGTIGDVTVASLSWIIGPGGTWLLIIGWVLSMCWVVTGLDMKDATNRWLLKIENVGPSMGRRSFDVGKNAWSSLQQIKENFFLRFQRDDDSEEEWEDDESWYSESELQYTDDGLEIDDIESLPPSSPFVDDDEELLEKSFFKDFPEEDELFQEPSVDFTRTRVQKKELVEVEWDPTIASDPGTAKEMAEKTRRNTRMRSEDTLSIPNIKSHKSKRREVAPKQDLSERKVEMNDYWKDDLSKFYDDAPGLDIEQLSEDGSEEFESESDTEERALHVDPPVQRSFVSPKQSSPRPSKQAFRETREPTFDSVTNQSVANSSQGIQLPDFDSREADSYEQDSASEAELSYSERELSEEVMSASNRVQITPGNLVSGGAPVKSQDVDRFADFQLPSYSLLDEHQKKVANFDEEELQELAITLEEKLSDFGVRGEVSSIRPGPVITTFEYKPARGVKISKISSLTDDIAMALKAVRVRIVAPIPGKDVVGIEIPNKSRQIIWSTDLFCSDTFQDSKGILTLALGKTVEGTPYCSDLAKMPHLLVGGTTGSGKSVGINTMILSMLFRHTPETLRLILIDPKMLEFEMYHDIPHLIHPVITDPNLATGILKWACDEMDKRYALMAKFKTRTIGSFNKRLAHELQDWTPQKAFELAPLGWEGDGVPPKPKKMPYLVVIIDELADLMMVAGKDVESSIIRLAQKARACGIHLIVATQRPSVDVITGMIKANMPCRIAFQVRQRTDARTILDQNGAENLLGKGDMLFLPPGVSSLQRCHGPFVTDDEVRRVTDYLRAQGKPIYEAKPVSDSSDSLDSVEEEYDKLYDQAVEFVVTKRKASTSMVQRKFKIGYNRAARIIECMEREGVISQADGSKPRKVLVEAIDP